MTNSLCQQGGLQWVYSLFLSAWGQESCCISLIFEGAEDGVAEASYMTLQAYMTDPQ